MLIWGEKEKVKHLGFVADYCIICRQIQPFFVKEIGIVSHIYWIPLSEVKVVGHPGICEVCGVSMSVEPRTYKGFSPDCDSGIEQLIADTYPTIHEALRERFELYEKAKRHAAFGSEEARKSLILEPFQLLVPLVEEKFGGDMSMGPGASVSLICTVLLLFVLLIVLGWTEGARLYTWLILSGASLVLGIFMTCLLQKQHRRSFFKKNILPPLAHSLRELNPKIQEIYSALESCTAQGLKIGIELSEVEVLNAIQEAQQSQTIRMDANVLFTEQRDDAIDANGGWPIK